MATAEKSVTFSPTPSQHLPTIAEEKPARHELVRRRLITICSSSKTDEREDGFEGLCSKVGCRPLLGIFSSLFARSHHHNNRGASSSCGSASAAVADSSQEVVSGKEFGKGESLLELSRRQQAALDDKQDTIDMLEWQLEELQNMAMKEREITGICCRNLLENGEHLQCEMIPLREDEMGKREGCVSSPEGDQDRTFGRGNGKCPQRASAVSIGMEITATELLLEMTIVRATLAIRRFCKVFMKQVELSGYSVWRTLADLEPRTSFVKKEHTALALESSINKALFHCFENESFDEAGLTSILDPARRALSRLEEFQRMKLMDVSGAVDPAHPSFEPDFFRFCENKTHEMWGMFPWNIVFKTASERNVFTTAFISACKGVWLLHRLAFSTNPVASIIRVGRRMEMNPLYVEPVGGVGGETQCKVCKSSKVEFMVMPGFRTHKVVKCQVYMHVECK